MKIIKINQVIIGFGVCYIWKNKVYMFMLLTLFKRFKDNFLIAFKIKR